MLRCENGHLMEEGEYCSVCGKKKKETQVIAFSPILKEEEIACHNCGKVQEFFHNYCTGCGSGLRLK